MRNKIEEEMVSKHAKHHNDPIEGPKLRQITESIGPNVALRDID